MLRATQLVNRIEDIRWIQSFRESSSWLILQLARDTVNDSFNINDDRVTDGSNVSGTERGARFTPVADP